MLDNTLINTDNVWFYFFHFDLHIKGFYVDEGDEMRH